MSSSDERLTAAGPGEGAVLAGGQAHPPDDAVPLLLDQAFDSGTLYALRAAAQAHAMAASLAEDRTDDLMISVHELAANAVRHGAGGGRVRMWQRDGALHCQVEDVGLPAKAADETPGPDQNVADRWPFLPGHGLWLVRLVSDQLSLSSGPDGSRVTVVFFLPAKDPSVSSPG